VVVNLIAPVAMCLSTSQTVAAAAQASYAAPRELRKSCATIDGVCRSRAGVEDGKNFCERWIQNGDEAF